MANQNDKAAEQPSVLARLSGNQLLNVVVGFMLTGLIGTGLTNHYATKQRELDNKRLDDRLQADRIYQDRQKAMDIQREDRAKKQARLDDFEQHRREEVRLGDQRRWELRRTYRDTLNQTRVLKIADVWEKMFIYEATLSRVTSEQAVRAYDEARHTILSKFVRTIHLQDYPDGDVMPALMSDPVFGPQIRNLQDPFTIANDRTNEVLEFADRNRLWLGERRYKQIHQYLDMSRALVEFSLLPAKTQPDERRFDALRKRRDSLRQQFATLRDEIWNE